jgi:hypothetical protein
MGLAPTTYGQDDRVVYIEQLRTNVTARLEGGGELTPKQKGALKGAAAVLKRDGKSNLGDVKQLSVASAILNRAFPEDEEFAGAEEEVLANYLGVAEGQLATLRDNAPAEGMPAAFAKLLTTADTALIAAAGTNDIASRSRELSKGLAKIKAAQVLYLRTVKAPGTIEGMEVTLHQRGADDVVVSNGTYTRTGPRAATLVFTPEGGTEQTVNLGFRNGTTGSFNGDLGKGTFVIAEPVIVTAE